MPVKPISWRRGTGDQGSVGVTFAILLASGVLLGMLAIVVDVGRLYVERDDLQNGADAAALALARSCAAPATSPLAADCASLTELRELAQRYADDNAGDGTSTVDLDGVCGVAGLPGLLPPCGDGPDNLTRCLGERPAAQYVEVHLSTRMPDGSTVLPPAFAQTLSGGDAGTRVGACARAAWGPRDMSILAITISTCEFDEDTRRGFGDETRPNRNDEHAIQFWEEMHGTCGPPGPEWPWESPGRAGFLVTGGSACEVAIDNAGIFSGRYFDQFDAYERAPESCNDRIRRAWQDREVIYLPVHDGVRTGPGGTASFRHVSVAPFLVTAYQFGIRPGPYRPSIPEPDYNPNDYLERSWVPGTGFDDEPCGNPPGVFGYRCLTGVFVGPPIPIEQLTGDARIRLDG